MDTHTLTILDYVRVLFRQKWFLFVPWYVTFVLFSAASFFMPKIYESNAVILVEEEKVINPLISGIAVSTSVIQRYQTLKEEILGWNRLVKLVERLKLDKGIKNPLEYEGLILDLKKNISVRMRGPEIILISYQGKIPQVVQQIVRNITDIFIEEHLKSQGKEADVAIKFIEDQLNVYRHKIKEAELAGYKEQLDNLLSDVTEEHPQVADLRKKVKILEEELNSEIITEPNISKASPLYGNIHEEIKKLKQRYEKEGVISALSRDDPNATENLYALMMLDKLGTSEARDTSVNEKIYDMLLERLETAKITQRLESSREGTRFKIIDPARIPLRPKKPNKLIISFLGFVLGGFLGVGCVFGREYTDHSFKSVEDAKTVLELPILGAISKISTIEEVNKEAIKQKKAIIVAVIIIVCLIIIGIVTSLMS
ncbi:MAG: GNVR domain-containing protein [Candidatus Omnitrophota bacterium]